MVKETFLSNNGVTITIDDEQGKIVITMTVKGETDTKVISYEDFITGFVTMFFMFNKVQRTWFVKYLMDNVGTSKTRIPMEEYRAMCITALRHVVNNLRGEENDVPSKSIV